MKEYDIFLPLFHNDGSPVDPRKFRNLQERLRSHFEGLTFFPEKNEGYWTTGGFSYKDEIVIYRVLSSRPRVSRRFLLKMKEALMKDFDQEEILIVERDVKVL